MKNRKVLLLAKPKLFSLSFVLCVCLIWSGLRWRVIRQWRKKPYHQNLSIRLLRNTTTTLTTMMTNPCRTYLTKTLACHLLNPTPTLALMTTTKPRTTFSSKMLRLSSPPILPTTMLMSRYVLGPGMFAAIPGNKKMRLGIIFFLVYKCICLYLLFCVYCFQTRRWSLLVLILCLLGYGLYIFIRK